MPAPVKGVEVERELETEKSFHGSVSELRKPVKANPAFVQFAWENEPHWMFVLFFSHFLFWLEARAGVRATDALARSPRGARTDSTERVEALARAPGPRRRNPPQYRACRTTRATRATSTATASTTETAGSRRRVAPRPDAFARAASRPRRAQGGFGSGVFPISLILTVVSTVTVGVKAYHFKPSKFKKMVAK
jgi:hypothetical protein